MDHQFEGGEDGKHQQRENQPNKRGVGLGEAGGGSGGGGGGGGGDGGGGGGDGGDGGKNNNHPPAPPCPRCNSLNTKFCYYNNYSLSQPRFFCKGCRRYWTQGGTLRNVPVGGGCRKSKRPKVSSSSSSASASSSGSASSSMSQLLPLPLPLPLSEQQHHQLMPIMSTTTAAATAVPTSHNNNNNMLFERESPGFFMSSLAAMQQGVSQPLTFGPNLGLLHGFSLPSFQLPQNNNNHQHDQLFQNMYSIREIGGSSSSSNVDWNLGIQPGAPPPLPSLSETNNSNSNSNNNTTNNNSNTNTSSNSNNQINQWADFMGNSGLDDP